MPKCVGCKYYMGDKWDPETRCCWSYLVYGRRKGVMFSGDDEACCHFEWNPNHKKATLGRRIGGRGVKHG